MGNWKYEITDDLRLHVWEIDEEGNESSGMWYQDFPPWGGVWESKEQIFAYLEESYKEKYPEIVEEV